MTERHDPAWIRISGASKKLVIPLCVATFIFVTVLHPAITLASTDKVMVHPGQNIQSLVATHPAGTVFSIAPGLYRLQSIRPKDDDSFIGEPGAILSGAKELTDFTHQGQYWVASVAVKSRAAYRGECDTDHPACMFPQDLFVNDVPLQRVDRLSDVSAGKWFLDYGKGQIYLSENPASRKVEISLIAHAFYGSARNVTIQGLTIEKYADVAGDGAIEGQSENGDLSQGWVIQNNVIELNHGMGVRLGNQMQVLNNSNSKPAKPAKDRHLLRGYSGSASNNARRSNTAMPPGGVT